MAEIVVTGGGMCGLSAAMLLAEDGHAVTVVERDEMPPPDDNDEAWQQWERRGVNQFRLLHYLLPRFRAIVEAELPAVAAALDAAGARRYNPLTEVPAELTGGPRDGDDDHVSLTARRPVAEAAVARVAAATPGVSIRRGTSVKGLRTGSPVQPGVPHVTGVVLDDGEELAADLVVDATGRRSPLPSWLTAVGARPPGEELEDSGFVYYARHFRGVLPAMFGPLLQHHDSLSILTLPADNETWGVGLIASGRDKHLRALRHVDRWSAALAQYPLVAHWADGEPLDDGVAVIGKIEDRIRHFVLDGTPVATGVLAVGDSWACTNPSVGRGISIGLLHAVALRDILRERQVDDPLALAMAWDDVTRRVVEPWYRATLSFDRARLAEIDASIDGTSVEPDPAWDITRAMDHAAGQDPDVLRGYLRITGVLSTADEVLSAPGFVDKVITLGGGWRDAPAMGPDRAGLLATVNG